MSEDGKFTGRRRVYVFRFKHEPRVSYEPGMFMTAEDVRRFIEGDEVVSEEMDWEEWQKHPDNPDNERKED